MSIIKDHPKFQAIVQAGRQLFWKHGVKRVALQEICHVAGTSKVTFYRFFDNKIALAQYLLDEVLEAGLAQYKAVMQERMAMVDRLEKIIVLKLEQTNQFSEEFIRDVYLNESLGLRAHLEARSAALENLFLDDLAEAQKRGELRSDVSRPFLRYQFQRLKATVSDPALLATYDRPQDLIMEVTRYFLYGLLPAQTAASNANP